MFCNTIVERNVINEKINFQESSVIEEERDCITPSGKEDSDDEADDKHSKDLPKTAVKDKHNSQGEQKRTRPKEKGLRILSQKAY